MVASMAQTLHRSTLRSHSQQKEDLCAYHTFFSSLRGGTFVELGALDGEIYSNTKLFEDALGWSGVLIEANPALFPHLCAHRKCSERIHAAICSLLHTVTFIQRQGVVDQLDGHGSIHRQTGYFGILMLKKARSALGGVWELIPESYRRYGDMTEHYVRTDVSCVSLQHIFTALQVRHVDFLSLDVEGAELSVLQTVDFTQVEVDVIVVELDGKDDVKDERVRQLLRERGFVLHGAQTTGMNAWFVRKGSRYEHVPKSLLLPQR